MNENIAHILDEKCHRKPYLDLFTSEFNFSPTVELLSINNIFSYLKPERILFASISLDKSFKYFFMISLIRAFLMKPTCTILVGDILYLDDLQPNHIKIKKICMRLWKHLYKQTTLSIIPYHLDDRLAIYTKNYIYDPHMWDLYCDKYRKQLKVADDYAKKQTTDMEKPLIVFFGKVTLGKGLKEFVEFVEINKSNFQFIIAGYIPEKSTEYTEQLKNLGVKIIDEYLEESKFLGLYEIADFAWCCYKPYCDQTSGIFGRAIQFGVIPIVRKDSMIDRIAKNQNLPCVELDFESEDQIKKMPPKFNKGAMKNSAADRYVANIKDESLNKLKRYLYI